MTDNEVDNGRTYTKGDFEFGPLLGKGAYSEVVLTTFKPTRKKYATKVIQKQLIIRENKVKTVKMEKQVLHMMDHPNIIKLFCTYQDKENLYFALELASGGELFTYITKYGPLSFEATQFYAAETVEAMEYMHSKGIIHRDLKPENMILNKDMHLKITDFGTVKIKGMDESENDHLLKRKQKQTFCGTAQYVSPELLKDEECTEASDLWALGCIIFQFLTGKHPFTAESEYLIFQKILKRDFAFPPNFPDVACDIVDKLLQLKPEDRLGMGLNGYKELKEHPFFVGIDFSSLDKQVPPPIQAFKKPEPEVNDISYQQLQNDAWKQFLLKQENVVYSSLVIKRRKLSAKKRQLILTDRPRLMYVDTNKKAIKGTIPWSKDLKISKKSEKDFVVSTPGRDYFFEDLSGPSDEWVRVIELYRKGSGF